MRAQSRENKLSKVRENLTNCLFNKQINYFFQPRLSTQVTVIPLPLTLLHPVNEGATIGEIDLDLLEE